MIDLGELIICVRIFGELKIEVNWYYIFLVFLINGIGIKK